MDETDAALQEAAKAALRQLQNQYEKYNRHYQNLKQLRQAEAQKIRSVITQLEAMITAVAAAGRNVGEDRCCSALEATLEKLRRAASMLDG